MSQPSASFSVTVPADPDEGVLEATLWDLCATEQPPAEVLVVVGSDDGVARAVAARVAGRHPDLVKVVVDPALFDVMADDVGQPGSRPPVVPDRVARAVRQAPARAAVVRGRVGAWVASGLARVTRNLRGRRWSVARPSLHALGRGQGQVVVGLLAFVALAVAVATSIHAPWTLSLLCIGVVVVLGATAGTTVPWMANARRCWLPSPRTARPTTPSSRRAPSR